MKEELDNQDSTINDLNREIKGLNNKLSDKEILITELKSDI